MTECPKCQGLAVYAYTEEDVPYKGHVLTIPLVATMCFGDCGEEIIEEEAQEFFDSMLEDAKDKVDNNESIYTLIQ